MTLVPNHLRLLNGSKLLVLVFILGLFSSCGSTRKTTKSRGTTPRTTTKKNTNRDRDRVRKVEWEEKNDDSKPPIEASSDKSPDKITIEKKDVYNVTYFIPLDANNYNNSASASDRFVQYYAGMLVATDILEKEGVSLNVNVVDEKKRKFSILLDNDVDKNTDVIVGPYDRGDLKEAAEFGKKNEIPVISPWQASNKIAKDNPYYIQLRPNLDEHYYSIFEHIKDEFDAENVFLIGRKSNIKDQKRIDKLQEIAGDVWQQPGEAVINEFDVSLDSLNAGETAYDSIFIKDKTTVIVLPNWSFEDESFIYNALRKLSVEKGMNKVVVYGMPIMLESNKISFDYYNALNMRVARSKFVDEAHRDVQRFKRDFVNKYGALPSDDAYEGYDNLMFIGRNLKEYGKNFQYYLNQDQGYYLQAGYRVEPTRRSSSDDNFEEFDYFENKNVDILIFKNSKFTRSKK